MASSLIDEIASRGREYLDSQDENARKSLIRAAGALIMTLSNPGEILARIGWEEPSRTAALRTAFEMGLLKKLDDTATSSADLAMKTKGQPDLVARTLKHLASNGLVKEVEMDSYTATPFSLATNDPTIKAGLIYNFEAVMPTFQGLPEFLAKTDYKSPSDENDGPVQYGLKTDEPLFTIFQNNPRLGSAFNTFMTGYRTTCSHWTNFYPIEERLGGASESETGPLLVDLGGGLGREITTFHAARGDSLPGELVLQDLSSVITQVEELGSLPEGIRAVIHNFFEPQPPEYMGARAYFMRLVLHDWPDERCVSILSNIRDAMAKGHSKLLINEAVMADTGAPCQQTSLDWAMMAMVTSRERTESQWKWLLARAGLKVTGIWSKDSESLIEAVRHDDDL